MYEKEVIQQYQKDIKKYQDIIQDVLKNLKSRSYSMNMKTGKIEMKPIKDIHFQLAELQIKKIHREYKKQYPNIFNDNNLNITL